VTDLPAYLLVFVLSVVVYTASLWLGAKLTRTETTFLELLVISAIAAVVGLVPYGGLISLIVLFLLLHRWAGIEPFPDAALMVVVAFGLRVLLLFTLRGLLE
jgi:hypothetical protein